ncbi:GNAT family N-acetyltransferase [Tessaracoccus sp. SD287]|uniref:GNAT family N-acetyltransferase n=1 Tax=Tessaracoccus sp. SD287 TaxID=2782008 RepID=UPI001A95D377|nr:GNAT family N-acetyltransferase [Tessaracoccus sp. SD287]MBO1030173.1 GNAT family N-acetyltransferase [Tessaracoccus sp. SD287]
MTEPDVEPRLQWSWLTEADLPALADLREATDYVDDPIERADLQHMRDLFSAPGADPERNGAVGRDKTGSVVAYAWGHPRMGEGEVRYWVDWAIHPAWRHQGIGVGITTWLRDQGMAWWEGLRESGSTDPLWMGAHIDEKLTLRTTQMAAAGFVAERWFSDMKVSFDEVPPHDLPLVVPEGIDLVGFDESLSEAVRTAHNRAFATVTGAQRVSRSVWDHILAVNTIKQSWSWVALADGQVAGYAISSGHPSDWADEGYSEGWTEFLGTVPEWRGRGVARALLTASLRSFADAGLTGAGLGVDADRAEAAYHLFSDLGYQSSERLVLMGLRRG